MGAGEGIAKRFDGALIDLAVLLEFGEVVDESRVNDAIRGRGTASKAVQVLEISAMHFSAGGGKRGGGHVRAG
jgi:hypothetical protein